MENRIDWSGGRPAGSIARLDPPGRDGRGAGVAARAGALSAALGRNERGWHIDVAGPFDPDAPRGTYLDILV